MENQDQFDGVMDTFPYDNDELETQPFPRKYVPTKNNSGIHNARYYKWWTMMLYDSLYQSTIMPKKKEWVSAILK